MTATVEQARPLTARQAALYGWLYSELRDRGTKRTGRHAMQQFGMTSPNGVVLHLKALARKGYVRREAQRAAGWYPLLRPDGRPWRGFADGSGPADPAGLTRRQAELYLVLYGDLRDHARHLSVAAASARLGVVSNNTFTGLFKHLVQKGWLGHLDDGSGRWFPLRRPDATPFAGFRDID
jgi:predicted DNA-binding transcriptional regulator